VRPARPERLRPLLAKSSRSPGLPEGAATLRGHTAFVIEAAQQLLEHRGQASLRAAGLGGEHEERLRRLVRVGAAVHDLGKCSEHFQAMLRRERSEPQLVRHEALSLWLCWPGQPLGAWLLQAVQDEEELCLALVCAAAHHRKFLRDAVASKESGAGTRLTLLTHHPDFGHTLELIARRLSLGAPPTFTAPHEVTVSWNDGPEQQLREWQEDFERRVGLGSPSARLLSVAKALVLAADVAGSALPRAEEKPAWIGEELTHRASGERMFSVVEKRLDGHPLRPFQQAVARSRAPLTLAQAGCGTGKTVAAYAWAARQYPGRQLWLTYPTTGTATEGFRGYVRGSGLAGMLEHGRAEVDLRLMDLQEGDGTGASRTWDRLEALRAWGREVITCTVDTVLGLIQNQRKGLYAWPALCEACVVFDEVHAYDARLFGSLLRFLEALPGIPALVMTASLPTARLQALRALSQRVQGVALEEVEGPEELEQHPRYRRLRGESPWQAVEDCLGAGGKVLWVNNTVDRCLDVAGEAERRGLPVLRYHSRFRYVDRVRRHQDVIEGFQRSGPALACTTQVAEMSLDLSAGLLVTELAPIPSLIQRLGRLNRGGLPTEAAPFVVLPVPAALPYEAPELREAEAWLERLGDVPVSQRALREQWQEPSETWAQNPIPSAWLDGRFTTVPDTLRESSPGLTVLRQEDAKEVQSGRVKAQEVALPMNMPPSSVGPWQSWPRVQSLPVAPPEALDYDEQRGARWRKP
jgi:CRISPR-associated endonuclease/helicase Cas3